MSTQNIDILKQHPLRTVSILALATFGVITTEFGLIGALQLIADDFEITLSQSGLLLSIYAIIVAVFGPFVTLSLSKYNQKLIICLSVGLFLISTLISTFANSYILMVISRILAALVHGTVWSLALVIASNCFPVEKRAKSVSYVMLGFIFASVIGIPATSYLSTTFSWRWGFGFASFVNFLVLIGLIFILPNITSKTKMTLGNQLGILKNPLVWINMSLSIAVFAGLFSVYGYFAPYFSKETGMSDNTISIMLMLFGILGIFGNIIFGRITTSNNITKVVLSVIIAFIVIYNLIYIFNNNLIITIILISIWGIFFASTGIVVQIWATMHAQNAPAFANSLYVSFANMGITLGTFSGAMGIQYIGLSSLPFIAILFLSISLVLYAISILKTKNLINKQ